MDLKGRDSVPDTVHHVLVRVDPDRDEADLMETAPCRARTDGAALGGGSEEQRAERLKRLKPQVRCMNGFMACGEMSLFQVKQKKSFKNSGV